MNERNFDPEKPTRRQFLRGGAAGAWLVGASTLLSRWTVQGADATTPAKPTLGSRKLGPEFTYDVSKLRQTDPKLLKYDPAGTIATGLKELRAVAVGIDDKIYAGGDRAVLVFDSTGARLQEIKLSEPPRCLAVAANGSLYVGLKDHVEVFAVDGKRAARWDGLGGKAVLTCVAVAEADVFVADAGNRIVVRYDLSGRLVSRIGKKDAARNVAGFIVPSPYFDLHVGPEGLLWVVNPGRHRLEAFTFEGDYELSWGEVSNSIAGFCGCCNPSHFARLPDGRFVTSEKGLMRVKVYSAKGEFLGVVAGPESFASYGEGQSVGLDVAADSKGRILVADTQAGQVRIYAPKPA